MPASGYFLVRVQELQRPEVVHSVKVRWYSSIKDLKDQLHLITHEPPSTQHIFHSSNPTEFRNSSTLQSIGIEHDGFTLQVAFDDYVRAPFYLEPLKKELIDGAGAEMLEEVKQGLMRDRAPKVTDELDGSGGSYFLRSSKGFYAAVFKPHDEEQGMPNNPKGYSGDGDAGLRDHFRPGQGCLREVAAYILDRDNFCGVPPTALVHCQHPSFSYPTTAGKRKLFPKLGSLQQFIKASECFDDLGPGMFSDFEIQKIALLDLRLLNCDRNAANMLVRYKRHVSTSSSASEGYTPSDDYLPTPSFSTDTEGKDWFRSISPVDESADMYEIVPIDHGYCMPSKLRIDEYDLVWMSLPQVKREVHPAIKDYVATLDFEAMLYNVLEQISLPGNSIFLLALGHLLVVQGIASGLTLYEIATLVARLDDEHASKLEQAIEEAEENAFRAIEMKSKRILSNPSLQGGNHHHPNMKSLSSAPSPLKKGSSLKGGIVGSPQKDMELASPGSAPSQFPGSLSMVDLQQDGQDAELKHGVGVAEKISIGTDGGVWDIKSLAACASPSTSVMKSISPRVPGNKSSPPGRGTHSTPAEMGGLSGETSFSVSITACIHSSQKPCPLELGSDFLSDLILAATEDDCEVAVCSPNKLSPLVVGSDAMHAAPKLGRSPLSKRENTNNMTNSYLAPIEEERRMRGGSTGSTCSSTDNNGMEPPVSDPTPTRDPSVTAVCTDTARSDLGPFINRHGVYGKNEVLDRQSLGVPLAGLQTTSGPVTDDVVYRSENTRMSPSVHPKSSLLTSPKFLSALSDMHGSQIIEGSPGSIDMLSTFPLQGLEISRMRSVGPSSSDHRPMMHVQPQKYGVASNSNDKSGEHGPKTDSTFEGVGSGFEIDIDPEETNGNTDGNTHVQTDALEVSTQNLTDKVACEGQSELRFSENRVLTDMYSPLARILAVPSDPNLSTSLLERCMTAGENNMEPIDQPSLRKLPSAFDSKPKATITPTDEAFSEVETSTEKLLKETPQRKRKHELFASQSGEHAVEGDSTRPYLTPSPSSRAASKDSQRGSRSATQEAARAWMKKDDAADDHSNTSGDAAALSAAPSMARVASFSGFESAPIYDFHAEGRFGSLRQEKRKAIMKTPEFNKFRLHFAHEAVLSIINRLLKQKDAQKVNQKEAK